MEPPTTDQEQSGLGRRDVLRRSAIVGGAMVWTVPAVQSIAGAAFAAGTPLCDATLQGTVNNVCSKIVYDPNKTCCDCLAANAAFPLPLAIALCALGGQCTSATGPQPC